MKDTSHHTRKKLRFTFINNHNNNNNNNYHSKKLFTLRQRVEVRSHEHGFQGSWHPGKITKCTPGCRVVKYDHILSDDLTTYSEPIAVSGTIDGTANESGIVDRCRIRPAPPPRELVADDLHYALCVDSYINEAWWEGVIFDYDDGSSSREVLFPDLGDLATVELKDMRITWDWDETTGEWKQRGEWLFLESIKKYELDNMIPISIRQIWYDMRVIKEFGERVDWWLSENVPLWEQLIVKVIDEYLKMSAEQFLSEFNYLEAKPIDDDNEVQGDAFMLENETLETEPMALSIIPPCSTSSLVLKFKFNRSKLNCQWKPFEDLEPEFSPECVTDYYNSDKPTSRLTKKFRQHVLFLGWTLEMSMYGTFRQQRVRYISPKGKCYYSPRDAIPFLSEGENSPEIAEDVQNALVRYTGNQNVSQVSTDLQYGVVRKAEMRKGELGDVGKYFDLCVTPKYCPEAINKYLESFKASWLSSSCSNDLADNARMHLAALGWTFWLVRLLSNRRKDLWRYHSCTANKTYYSLKTACESIKAETETNATEDVVPHEALLGEKQTNFGKMRTRWKRRNKRKQKSYTLKRSRSSRFKREREDMDDEDTRVTVTEELNNEQHSLISSFVSKKKKALKKVKGVSDSQHTIRVLRSSKRVRQIGPSTSSQLPRTVLSWLIENNAVVPRSKVYYYEENSTKPLAEGRIASDGIRCSCCQKLHTLSSFQAHASGNNNHRPAENIFLEDGKSLVSCQAELMRGKLRSFSREPIGKAKGTRTRTDSSNDHICSICHYGGELILCDQCPSSFHADCLHLTGVPDGDWFCPSCCCGVCGESQYDKNTEQHADNCFLCCHQCERKYHPRCKKDRDVNAGEYWFCCRACEKVHWGLEQLLGKPILVGHDSLTWTLVKPMQYQELDHEDCDLVAMAENYSKLSVALEVMHECFEPVKEPRTKRDIVEDVLFCRGSNLNRLNFKGFYTVLLERNDELITVAILRVYGDKVAEIPLIGTRFQHRRLGMCRVLMNEIEKNLMNLGVQKLVLPAAASVINTWTTAFGFSRVTDTDRSDFLSYTFLDFQDTTMCQKLLRKLPPLPRLSRDMSGVNHQRRRIIEGSNSVVDHEGNSSVSEVFQEDQREGSETVDQGGLVKVAEDKINGNENNPDAPSTTVTAIILPNQEGEQPCNTSEFLVRKKLERAKSDANLQCYKRKKATEPRPPPPQTGYSKVEVSCG